MAQKTVNPTRMELSRLKARLKTASRGHKLLGDKRDELMRQFLALVRSAGDLRQKVEAGLEAANRAMTAASDAMSPAELAAALARPSQSVILETSSVNIMGVETPVYRVETRDPDPSGIFPYGFASTVGELDEAIGALSRVFGDMLALAQAEKTCQLLADEIERTRRRAGALEHVLIPDMQQKIRYISMRLQENERSNTVRLMRVKEQVLSGAHNFR